MDNIGDWLYIVILVITGISGLFSKYKKKQTKPVQRPNKEVCAEPEVTPQKGFWEIFKEMLEPEQEEPEQEMKRQAIKEVVQEKKHLEPKSVVVSADEPPVTEHLEQHKQPVTTSESNIPSAEVEFGMVIDWRKAVVYAEILNRKY